MSEHEPDVAPHLRRDAWTGRLVYVAPARSQRWASDPDRCPFCVGGDEAPASYAAPYWFSNRWPAMEPGRCEIVVHNDDHRDFGSMPTHRTRQVVDIWADRSQWHAHRPEVSCVLVFENRGPEAGATVAHPHSQVFALPIAPVDWRADARHDCPGCAVEDQNLVVWQSPHWRVEVPHAPMAPYCLRIVARRHVASLVDLADAERDELAVGLAAAIRCLDGLFDLPMPYHLWVHQDLADATSAHLAVHIVGLRRSAGRLFLPGAAETATGLRFTSVDPAAAAAELRAAAGSLVGAAGEL